MSATIRIGEARLRYDAQLDVACVEVGIIQEPTFPDSTPPNVTKFFLSTSNEITTRSNWPSSFARRTNLESMFYGGWDGVDTFKGRRGLFSNARDAAPLIIEHHDAIKSALLQANLRDDDAAFLAWLDFWIAYALTKCSRPTISSSF